MLSAATNALSLPVVGAIITAAVGVLVAFVTAGFTWANAKRERRRTATLDAFEAAIAWPAYLDRVCSCRSLREESELRQLRSDLRQRSAVCEGAMWSESRTLGCIYESLSRYIQTRVDPKIDAAWRTAPCERAALTFELPIEVRDVFFREVRANLSFMPWKRWALRRRYPERKLGLHERMPVARPAAPLPASSSPSSPPSPAPPLHRTHQLLGP